MITPPLMLLYFGSSFIFLILYHQQRSILIEMFPSLPAQSLSASAIFANEYNEVGKEIIDI
jgi:hypothetical protein